MPWGVDDIDAAIVVIDGCIFSEDGDPLFTFQVVRVHDALDNGLVGAEGSALAQHLVYEGRLAVVDMRNDGDIANFRLVEHRFLLIK